MDTKKVADVAHAIERQLAHQLTIVEQLIQTEDTTVVRSHLQAHLSMLRNSHGKALTLAQLTREV